MLRRARTALVALIVLAIGSGLVFRWPIVSSGDAGGRATAPTHGMAVYPWQKQGPSVSLTAPGDGLGFDIRNDNAHESYDISYEDLAETWNATKRNALRKQKIGQSEEFCWCLPPSSSESLDGQPRSSEPGTIATCKKGSQAYKQPIVQDSRKAVESVCKMAPQVKDMRHNLICQQMAITQQIEEWVVPDADTVECNASSYVKRYRSKADLPDRLKRLRKKQQILEALPAVASISAVKPLLWSLSTTSELFYTKANAMKLRSKHKDPFTNDTLKHLPPELPNIQMPTCSIVGNSGILRRHQLGKQIDSATVVVRINQGPATEAYHDIAGSKTHIRVLNRQWTKHFATRNAADLLQSPDAGGMIIATRAATRYYEQLSQEVAANATNKMILLANHQLVGEGLRLLRSFRNGIQEGLGLRYKGGDSPSSGFLAILLMMQICTKPTIYGFSLDEQCKRGRCGMYHYFSNNKSVPDQPRMSAYKGHTYANEGWLLKALHILGVVCIEPPPMGLGMCGEHLGGRITEAGVPTAQWGGSDWEDVGRLVAQVATDVKYMAKTRDGKTVTWMGRPRQKTNMADNGAIPGSAKPQQLNVKVTKKQEPSSEFITTASRGFGKDLWGGAELTPSEQQDKLQTANS